MEQDNTIKTQNASALSTKFSAWLQLIRLPNLLTVPGDPLAGFTLAYFAGVYNDRSNVNLQFCIFTSLLFYCAALLQNDYCDIAKDRETRPNRPLPSGLINPRSVVYAALTLFIAGLLTAALAGMLTFVIALTMVALISSYNCMTKGNVVIGAINVGLCRGLSLLLGASALGTECVSSTPVIVSALGLTCYIASVTTIAAKETQTVSLNKKRWLPTIILTCWFTILYFTIGIYNLWSLGAYLVLASISTIWALYLTINLTGKVAPKIIQQTVGQLIRNLLLIQAAVISVAGLIGILGAVTLILAWPISYMLSKRFYAS
ncbi:MAG: hypothetical protein FVQ80_05000 [Planctomycetes bacterium]|nr:hypothetical protein [Planctomycetota bacterium]